MEKPSIKRKIIAITNHKGGVGKTALCVNLIRYMLEKHVDSILLLDLDPQANLTWTLNATTVAYSNPNIGALLSYAVKHNIDKEPEAATEFDKMRRFASVTTWTSENKCYAIIPSTLDLSDTKIEISSGQYESVKYYRISSAIRRMAQDYDLTIIDTPPNIEMLTWAGIASSDYIILPCDFAITSTQGARDIIKKIVPTVKEHFNPNLEILGVLMNGHYKAAAVKVAEENIRKTFGSLVFDTIISRSAKVGELPNLRKTIFEESPRSKCAGEYSKLADEIVRRIENGSGKK